MPIAGQKLAIKPRRAPHTSRLTTAFQQAERRLNAAQRRAVDTIEGPVMVIAGPGTGKTEVVAVRVANILRKTQMRPSNILCLTFSKSGATAMRDRLRALIGPDAYRITVDTIHGFCNDIIVSHPELFEEWSAWEQISDVERYRAVNNIIDELMPDLVLVSKKAPYLRTKDIIARISQLKREGVTDRGTLLKIASEYEGMMKEKSKVGTKQHEKNLRLARKFREFLEVFFRYQHMLERTGRYDYDDMILHVTKALKEEDWLLASLQERYQYILVDEFQDLNGAQERFLETLTEDPTADKQPNFFIVGDDDQAIYRFQGANLTNILSFKERFQMAPIIPLTASYRSVQTILDAASSLIAMNSERLVAQMENVEKNLRAAREQSGPPPVLLLSPSDMSEPWLLADLVEERLQKGVPPQEIAIIVQTNRELPIIFDALRARALPVQISGKVDLLTHPLIGQVLAILRAIHRPQDNALFASALSCACFCVRPLDLAQLCRQSRERDISLVDLVVACLAGEVEDIRFLERDRLLGAAETLLTLNQRSGHRTILETLEHIFRDCGLLESTKSKMDFNPLDFAVAQEFFDRIKQRAYEQPSFSFIQLLSDLEFYEMPEYNDLRLTYDLPHLTDKGVQLMTAHKSKGLEFHTVIIANFREGHWDRRHNPPALGIPEDLLFGWEKEQKQFEQMQDERRLAYVAMTRAKDELLFTCPQELTTGNALKSVSPSGFFAESGSLPMKHQGLRNPELASTLLSPPPRKQTGETEAFLRKRIEEFSLSPTALNDFLEDPLHFLNRHLLQWPQARDPSYAYGNAVHHVLAEWALSVKKNAPMEEEDVLKLFREHLHSREVLTTAERKRLERLGEEALSRYYETHLMGQHPHVYKVEYEVRAHLKDIPLKGKIDRIDLLNPPTNEARVIDFKTGRPKSPKEIEKFGQKRQLLFYALLLEHATPLLHPKEFVLAFVGEEEEEPQDRLFAFTEQEKKELTALICDVWAKIIALDFTSL